MEKKYDVELFIVFDDGQISVLALHQQFMHNIKQVSEMLSKCPSIQSVEVKMA